MQKLTRSLAMAGALAFAGVLAGCGDDVTVKTPTTVTVTPPSASVAVGGTVTFTASVTGDVANKTVTWSSSDATKATVDANGKVTGVAVGNSSIIATSAADPNAKASALVTVTAVNKGVTKVEISPNTAIIKQGEFLQLTANVTADPGVARTVTWTSSANAVATVGTDGKVTAVSNGTAIITAASTVDPTVSGTMSLTVRPTQPAQISIQKVTTGNTQTPVNFNNVFGQIDVTLNLDPGDQTVTKVEVLVDNKTACSQNLSIAESQQLTFAAVNPEVQAVDIVCSINTAAFDANGVPTYLNGARQLTAKATIGGTQPGNVATPSQTLTFNNANSFILSQTLTGTTAQATSAAGLLYRRGSLNISVVPVIYNAGQTIAVATATFGTAACDANGTGARSRPLTAPAAGSGAWTTSFGVTTSSTVAIGTTVKDYEFNNSPGCLASPTTGASGEVATIVATDNAGNTIFTTAIPANLNTAGIRLDNRAPGVPTFWANPNGRRNSWINATVGLNGANNTASTTSNNWFVDGTADAGVGGYVHILRTAAATGGLVDAAIAATGSSTATLPAPSVANTSYCAVISAQDLLGNESALPAAGAACTAPPSAPSTAVAAQSLQFGVDIAPPTIAYADPTVVPAAMADGSRKAGASIGGEFIVTVADTGAVGNSGMLAGSPVRANVIRREANGTDFATAPTDCVVGTLTSSGTVCSQTATGLVVGLPLVSTAITALNIAGYYTYTATAFDAAGNSTALPAADVIVYDGTPATATNPSVPATITGAFSSASFLNDNLSIRDYYYTVGFNTAAAAYIAPATFRIAASPTVVDAFNAATLSNTNVGINTTINTFLGLQSTTAGNVPNAYAAGSIPLNALNLFVRDQAQAAYSGPATAVVAPTAPASGVSTTGFNTFIPATTNAAICAGTLAGGCAAGTFTSTVVTAKANGVTATFNNPFSRVDFYAPRGGDLILIGSVPAASASLVDDGATRVWTYSLTLTASTLYAQLGGVSPAVINTQIFAFGVSPSGTVALVAQPLAQTINP